MVRSSSVKNPTIVNNTRRNDEIDVTWCRVIVNVDVINIRGLRNWRLI